MKKLVILFVLFSCVNTYAVVSPQAGGNNVQTGKRPGIVNPGSGIPQAGAVNRLVVKTVKKQTIKAVRNNGWVQWVFAELEWMDE